MDFDLNDEQRAMRDALRAFLIKECPIEYVRDCDEKEVFPVELYRKLAAQGWLGIPIAEEYGGTGGSCMDLVLFLEELARHFEAAANLYYTTIVIAADAIGHFGTEAQKRRSANCCPSLPPARSVLPSRCPSPIPAPTPHRCAPARCGTARTG